MKKRDKMPIINGIVFTLLGFIIFFNPDSIITFVSYFLGGLLVGLGIYKSISYYIQNKTNGIVNQNELYFGICAIVLGLLIILLGSVVELLLRLTVSGWLIVAGILRLATTFYTTDRSNKFYALIIVGGIFIAAGIYTLLVSNIGVKIIGLFMAIYGIIDFISYFVYKGDLIVINNNKVKEAEVEEKEE